METIGYRPEVLPSQTALVEVEPKQNEGNGVDKALSFRTLLQTIGTNGADTNLIFSSTKLADWDRILTASHVRVKILALIRGYI